jgi:hypothetical protein
MATLLLENTQARPLNIAGLPLAVGINEITGGNWDRVKDNPGVKDLFDNGWIKWVRGPEEAKKVEKLGPYPLKGISAKEAIGIVKKTMSIPTLEGWLRIESRREITSAITAQIEEIKKTEEDPEENKELASLQQAAGK